MNKYYLSGKDEVLRETEASVEGLNIEEVKRRLNANGYNKLKESKKKSMISRFIDQFKNVMIIILLIAATLSTIVAVIEGESLMDTLIILVVVFLNALLGVMQESKAEKAIDALKKMSLPYIKVRRNGEIVSVKTEELVVGDIVLLEAGDYVPADLRILESHSLRVEEAALTGESEPVDKFEEVLKSQANEQIALADRINMAYSGSSIVYGRGEGVVTATGMNTELGKIAKSLTDMTNEETPLQKKMNEISKILSVIVVVIAVIMVIVGFMQGTPVIDVFMLAIALAVAAIPEGLAAVITITLAIGVQNMAKENSIVRKLSSVEALGCTQVICSDKTGTLTQNRMTVRKIFVDDKLINVTEGLKETATSFDLLNSIGVLCNDTKINGNDLLGDPTETALIAFCRNVGIDASQIINNHKRVEEAPFDSKRKMMSTVNKYGDKYNVFVKGAIESVLDRCDKVIIEGKVIELTLEKRKEIQEINLSLAKEALRVLALAYKEESSIPIIENNEDVAKVEAKLIFVGLVAMIDPPRKEAKIAVEKCFEAGMIPVMITGDNIDTAMAIAKEIGIYTNNYLALTGVELDKMSDEELKDKVENIRVYARVSPENKIRIVKAWKSLGKTVAMTGDGVNDAPAIKGADIGIGMGITGTEVSKSVSSMVLADDNFATIVDAVKEGRRIYKNIQNVTVYLLACNLCEIFIIFFSTLFAENILIPIQILWINLISDTIPAIALGFEKSDKDIMKQKPRDASKGFFTPFLTARIVSAGIIKTVTLLIIYFILNGSYGHDIAASSIFIILTLIEILFAISCRAGEKSIFKIGVFSNKQMNMCVLGTLLLQVLMLVFTTTRGWLGVTNMSGSLYIVIGILSVCIFAILEASKLIIAKCYGKYK